MSLKRKEQIIKLREYLVDQYQNFKNARPLPPIPESDQQEEIPASVPLEAFANSLTVTLDNSLEYDAYALKIEERGQIRFTLQRLEFMRNKLNELGAQKTPPRSAQPEFEFYENFFFEPLRRLEGLDFPAKN